MRIAVCVKEVLDPNAVNNLALAGKLKIGEDGRTLEVAAVPRLINGYDEQGMEIALRIRDAGVACTIVAVSIGPDQHSLLRHCAALGADEIVAIDPAGQALDGEAVAKVLAAYVKGSGGADLILCGRRPPTTTRVSCPCCWPRSWDGLRCFSRARSRSPASRSA